MPGLGEDVAAHLHAGLQRLEILALGEIVGVDQRMLLGIAALQPDRAGALGAQRADMQRVAVLLEPRAAVIDHQRRQEMELHVGRRQAAAAC